MATRQLESKRKYEVTPDAVLPDLTRLPKVSAVEAVLQSTLEAVYADTDNLALANAGITLRRRTSGSDAGWHLKLPLGGDDRAELGEPLGDDADGVPPELVSRVRAWVRDQPLRPVATVVTRRVVHRLVSGRGKVLAEFSDDMVTAQATPQHGAVIVSSWREWEIELVDGSRKLLTAADELCAQSGASPSVWPSQPHQALLQRPRLQLPGGPAASTAATAETAETVTAGDAERTATASAGAVINAYLGEQVAVMLARDGDVRRSEPEAVHKMRVATRRLGSALSTFRPLYDPAVTDLIRDELKWLAGELGGVRDSEVQRIHLLAAVAAQPADLVLGPVATRIEVELQAAGRAARETLLAALDSSRYFRLLDSLDALVAAPPLTARADGTARSVIRKRVRHVCRQLQDLVSPVVLITDEPDSSAHDVRLDEIRKAAKRVRYAAEAAAPALGKSATALAGLAEEMQVILGDHQDSVVIRATLRAMGVRMFLDGENAFTLGRLHALQQSRAEATAAAFRQLWSSSRAAGQLAGWLAR